MTHQSQPTPEQRDKVRQLVEQWEDHIFRGEEMPLEVLCQGSRELLDFVQREIEALTSPSGRHLQTIGYGESFVLPTESSKDVPPPTRDDQINDVARYENLRFLARGGLGEVFVAQDAEINRDVAVKFIKESKADDESSRLQFAIEGEITGRLEHPGVVPVYGLGKTSEGRPFQVMPLIRGQSMADAINDLFRRRNSGELSSHDFAVERRQLLNRFVDVCQAVGYAHSRGIIHRDMKPDNVMLGKFGQTYVVDWGLAMPVERRESDMLCSEETLMVDDSTQATSSGVAGTPAYMSPEQSFGSEGLGPQSDIYSLGAMLYQLLVGQNAFSGTHVHEILAQVQTGTFVKPTSISRDVPRPLEAICLKAMELNVSQRYNTCLELAADVERWLGDEIVEAYHESRWERIGRWMRENRRLAQAIAFLSLLSVVALTVWGTSNVYHRRNASQNRLNYLRSQADLNQRMLQYGFDELKNDVRILAARPQMESLNSTESDDATKFGQLEHVLEEFLQMNPSYMQVRFLDNDGLEKARVDRAKRNVEPHIIPHERLQNKQSKPYFQSTMQLNRGEVYLSQIDINTEQGKHQWHLPMIRAATPVYGGASQKPLGIVIINMHFEHLTELVERNTEHLSMYLTNSDGQFLTFPENRDLSFSFERGLDLPFEAVFPDFENFRRSGGKIELSIPHVIPNRMLVATTLSQDATSASRLDRAVSKILDEPEFRTLKLRQTKYKSPDSGVKTIVLIGDAKSKFDEIEKRLHASVGKSCRITAYPKTTNQPDVYVRKFFFDENQPDRFLCVGLVAQPE